MPASGLASTWQQGTWQQATWQQEALLWRRQMRRRSALRGERESHRRRQPTWLAQRFAGGMESAPAAFLRRRETRRRSILMNSTKNCSRVYLQTWMTTFAIVATHFVYQVRPCWNTRHQYSKAAALPPWLPVSCDTNRCGRVDVMPSRHKKRRFCCDAHLRCKNVPQRTVCGDAHRCGTAAE